MSSAIARASNGSVDQRILEAQQSRFLRKGEKKKENMRRFCGKFNVRAKPVPDAEEGEKLWTLEFDFYFSFRDIDRCLGPCTFVFTVEEPYAVSERTWRDLANGTCKRVRLYQGNGEGSISLNDDNCLVFVAAPSGSGGDVRSTFEVPRSEIQAPLLAAIDKAVEAGYVFAPST